MNIFHSTFQQILFTFPNVPPEAGCILGLKNGIISELFFDAGTPRYDAGIYTPNVHVLNQTIADWTPQGIRFCGFAHSHPTEQKDLSTNDIAYIRIIMNAMPKSVKSLYFPLVFPGKEIISFVATRTDNEIVIMPDNITII